MGVWDYRAVTGPEQAKLESDGQSSRVGMLVLPDREVFSALVDAAPSTNDRVAEVTFNTPVGSPGDVMVDMTCLVGSSAGGYDVGICRVRKTISGSTLFLGETSDIVWTPGDHLTVLEDWQIWSKHVRIVGSGDDFVVYMDWDVPYTDQYVDHDPIPVLGMHIVKRLAAATVDVVEFDASDSWVPDSTIASYLWEAPGASATSGLATANPTLTYNATGWYRVTCTVTAANGKANVGHRWVRIYDDDDPPTWIEFGSCGGDFGQGGWTSRISGHYDVDLSVIRNRALLFLIAEDSFGGIEGGVSVVSGQENKISHGWISAETIYLDPDHSYVDFESQGGQFWLNAVLGFPTGIEDINSATDNWLQYNGLTVRRALWAFLLWRSTACTCVDFFEPDDETSIGLFNSGMSSLWSQISEASERTIKARACFDRFNRLFIQVNSQFKPVADRAGIPIVMDIEAGHWERDQALQLNRSIVARVGRVDLAGVAWDHVVGQGNPFFSLSPGHVMKQHGAVQSEDQMAVVDQAQANLLAGLICGNGNNPYPSITVPFAMNCRVWDLCPWQYGSLTVAATDNARGVSLTDYKVIPRRVDFVLQRDERGAGIRVNVDFEGYTTAETSVDGDPPPLVPGPGNPGPGPPPPIEPPPPISVTDPAPDVVMMILSHGSQRILVRTISFQDVSPVWVITLGSIGSRYYYRADFRAQTAYGYDSQVTDGDIYRIDNFNTVSPVETRLDFATHPDVIWAFGGFSQAGLAVSTDDPDVIAVGIRSFQAGRRRLHVSTDSGGSWLYSDEFPSETSYYGSPGSGVQAVYPMAGVTNSWLLLGKCGWDGPMYGYEIAGTDLPGASRSLIEGAPIQFEYERVVASGADGMDGLWFYARDPGLVDWSVFKGTIAAGASLTGPLDGPITIPFSPSTPGAIVGGQVKVYRAGWEDLGTTGLIKDAVFLAPCALDSSLRWAVGGFEVAVDTLLLAPIIKYCGTGGETDSDWSDKTGNLHILLDALGWTQATVQSIIPVLGGDEE